MDTKELSHFSSRKIDHLELALADRNQAIAQDLSFAGIHLTHEALPELNFEGISLETDFFGFPAASPLFISSMTAGNDPGEAYNQAFMLAASERKWPMGVGSQRRELSDPSAVKEWQRLRKLAPNICLFGNLGLAQLIQTGATNALKLLDNLQAKALIVHLNALQEALQPEGTPQFSGGLGALEALVRSASVPIIVKETGCGFSSATMQRLLDIGVSVIDISGYGGTHWGKIEGDRAGADSLRGKAAQTFATWGESTILCLLEANALSKKDQEIWASGGIRSGLDAAKALALGADKVGFAQPALLAAKTGGAEGVAAWMEQMEFELRLALFCTGSRTVAQLREGKKWRKI